jgi:hypothetical protein
VGAASADLDLHAQAVSLFITDMLAASMGRCNGVTTVAMPWLVSKLPDPGEIDVAACRSTITKGRSGKWSPTTISIMEFTVATSRERMAAHRERRRKNLVQFTVAVAADELAKIARSGYPEVQSEDEKRAVEALSLFITDTLAARSARVTALRRATPFQ